MHGSLPTNSFDDLVKGCDGLMQLVGAVRRLRVGLDRNHQILVGKPDVERPIAETLALVEPMRAEGPKNLVAEPEREAAWVVGGHRRDWLAGLHRNKLCPLFLLLRWNHLAAENRAHPPIDVAGACDGAAGGLHPGGAEGTHIPPDDRSIPAFFAFGLVFGASFIREIAVRKTLDDRLRVGACLVEGRGETVRLDHQLMDEIAE